MSSKKRKSFSSMIQPVNFELMVQSLSEIPSIQDDPVNATKRMRTEQESSLSTEAETSLQQGTPIAVGHTEEPLHPPAGNRQSVVVGEERLNDAKQMFDMGAPVSSLNPILEAAQEGLTLPTTPVRVSNQRTKRLERGVEALLQQINLGRGYDQEMLINFVDIMGYGGETKALQFAELGLDLYMQTVINRGDIDTETKSKVLQMMDRRASTSGLPLGVIQRKFYNIMLLVKALSLNLQKYSNSNTSRAVQSPYSRAYLKYFNVEHNDLFKYVITKTRKSMAPSGIGSLNSIHNVSISEVDGYKVAITLVDTTQKLSKPIESFYDPSVYGIDPAFINSFKTMAPLVTTIYDDAKTIEMMLEVSSSHFFGRGDITSLANRLTKVYGVYEKSQLWKRKYSTILNGAWVFRNAMDELRVHSNNAPSTTISVRKLRPLESDSIWSSDSPVGGTSFQRALWYFSDFLGYGKKYTDKGQEWENSIDYGLDQLIGPLSINAKPSRWLLAFYRKVAPTAADYGDAELLSSFLTGEEGELYRFVSDGSANPINLKAEAGFPYPPSIKKINALADIFIMSDMVYDIVIGTRADQVKSTLESLVPEIFLVSIKPKAEVFPLETPVDLEQPLDIDESYKRHFVNDNAFLPKGRGIYIPCSWTSVPFGIITSFISNKYVSLFEKLYYRDQQTLTMASELNNIMIPLKACSLAYGMFDFVFRRVQCQFPFNTPELLDSKGYGSFVYADNFYVFGEVSFPFESEEDTISLVYDPSEDKYVQHKNLRVMPGMRVYISADGEKAESATDEIDVISYLQAFCQFFNIPVNVTTFIMEAARYGINGGLGIFGNKRIYLPWQGSGNQLTFSLNDFKMAQVVHHYNSLTEPGLNRKIHYPTLKKVATYYGVSITLERLIVLPPLGEPIVTPNCGELDIDMLGLSAISIDGASYAGYGPVVAPVLAKTRRMKAIVFSKAAQKKKDKDEEVAPSNSELEFSIKAIALLLLGCCVYPIEKEICFNSILNNLTAIRGMIGQKKIDNVLRDLTSGVLELGPFMKIVQNSEFNSLLEFLANPTLSPSSRKAKLEDFFVNKYCSLISNPTNFKFRTSYIHELTIVPSIGSPTVLSGMYPLFGSRNRFGADYGTGVVPRTHYRSEQVFVALANADLRDTLLWPSTFILGDNGNIKQVTYDVKNPVFTTKMNAVAAQQNVKVTTSWMELFKDVLRWYLIERPYRSTGYESSIVESAQKRKLFFHNLETTRRVTIKLSPTLSIGQRYYSTISEMSDGTQVVVPVHPAMGDRLTSELKVDSTPKPTVNLNVSSSYKQMVFHKTYFEPKISLNVLANDTRSDHWKLERPYLLEAPDQERGELLCNIYIKAIGLTLFQLLSIKSLHLPLSEFLGGRAGTLSEKLRFPQPDFNFPAYPNLLTTPLLTDAEWKSKPVRFNTYHVVPSGNQYSGTIAVKHQLNPSKLAEDLEHVLSFLPNQLRVKLEALITEFGAENTRKLCFLLRMTYPDQEIFTLNLRSALGATTASQNDFFQAVATMLKKTIPISKFHKTTNLEVRTEAHKILDIGKDPKITVPGVIRKVVWLCCEMVLGSSKVFILRLQKGASGGDDFVDKGLIFSDSPTSVGRVPFHASVWECFYCYHLKHNLDHNFNLPVT